MKIIRSFLLGFCILIAAIFVYLVVIIFAPVLNVPEQPISKRKKERERKSPPASRQEVQFAVDGINVSAWLFLPQASSQPVPCLVMSNGFGGTMDCLLEQYALRLIEAGTAVLAFDYRHFGFSEGEPRQLFNVSYQLADVRAAIAYARSRSEIDPEKIVLWGTSGSGGYGLAIAAEDDRIAAVIGQCASLDHEADSKIYMDREGMGHFIRLFVHAQRDMGRSRLGLSPHVFPLVGQPGTLAMITAPGAFDGYARLVSDSDTFKNEVCARLLFMSHGPDLLQAAREINCPVLLLVCEEDNLVAPDSHVKIAELLGDKATVISYPIGHFDIYQGEYFEQAIGEMTAFLDKYF